MITSGHKNESWGDQDIKNDACMKTKLLEITNNRFFLRLSLSNLSCNGITKRKKASSRARTGCS